MPTNLQAGQDSFGVLITSEIMRGSRGRCRSSSGLSGARANAIAYGLKSFIPSLFLRVLLTVGNTVSDSLLKRRG